MAVSGKEHLEYGDKSEKFSNTRTRRRSDIDQNIAPWRSQIPEYVAVLMPSDCLAELGKKASAADRDIQTRRFDANCVLADASKAATLILRPLPFPQLAETYNSQ